MNAADERADVNFYDVAFFENPFAGRNPVNHFVIDGNARGRREPAVSEEGGFRTALFDVAADRIVNLFGRNSGLDHFPAECESFPGNPTGHPHQLNLLICLNDNHFSSIIIYTIYKPNNQSAPNFVL